MYNETQITEYKIYGKDHCVNLFRHYILIASKLITIAELTLLFLVTIELLKQLPQKQKMNRCG